MNITEKIYGQNIRTRHNFLRIDAAHSCCSRMVACHRGSIFVSFTDIAGNILQALGQSYSYPITNEVTQMNFGKQITRVDHCKPKLTAYITMTS